jgi:hypothetical protein
MFCGSALPTLTVHTASFLPVWSLGGEVTGGSVDGQAMAAGRRTLGLLGEGATGI